MFPQGYRGSVGIPGHTGEKGPLVSHPHRHRDIIEPLTFTIILCCQLGFSWSRWRERSARPSRYEGTLYVLV